MGVMWEEQECAACGEPIPAGTPKIEVGAGWLSEVSHQSWFHPDCLKRKKDERP